MTYYLRAANIASALLFIVILSFQPKAEANHDYLFPTKHPINLNHPNWRKIKVSSGQDIFEFQPPDFRPYLQDEVTILNGTHFEHARSLWIEEDTKKTTNDSTTHPHIRKTPGHSFNSLSVLGPTAGFSPQEPTLLYSFYENAFDHSFQSSTALKAEFVSGDWGSFTRKQPYILRLTPESQIKFNQFMKERIQLSLLQRFEKVLRPFYAKHHFWIKKLEFGALTYGPNISASYYWNKFQKTPGGVSIKAATYLFGDDHGLVSTHTNYELEYSFEITDQQSQEINWTIYQPQFKELEKFTSISLL
jgi:hypothetical protein